MAKVIIDKQFITSEIIAELTLNARTLQEIADFWAKRIFGFTKQGKSIVTNDRLKSLAPSYVDFRRRYKGAKGELFGESKSNLTLSGQMLDSMRGRANVKQQIAFIELIGTRDDGLKNSTLAGYVEEQGRAFLGLDDKGKERIRQIALRYIRRSLNERKKRRKL